MGERIAKGAALLTFGSLLSLFLSALGSIVVARELGPAQYGLVTIAMILPNLLFVLLDLGLTAALVRYTSLGRSDVVGTALALRTLIALLGGLANFLLAPLFVALIGRPELTEAVRLLSIFTTTHLLFSTANYILVGMGRYGESVLAGVLFTTLKVTLAIALVLSGYGVLGALLAHVISGLLVHLSTFGRALLLLRSLRFSPPALRELFAYSIPLYLPSLIGAPLGQIYYAFMASVSSNEEVGNLSVAYNFLAPLNALGGALSASVLSVLPSLASQERERAVRNVLRLTSLLLPSLSLGLVLLSEPAVKLLYGEKYQLAPLFLSAYLLGYLLTPLGSLLWHSYFASIGKSTVILRASIVQNLIGAPLYLGLTYSAGALGFVVAGILSGALSTLYMLRAADISAGIEDNLRAMSPSLLSFTASMPFLFLLDGPLSWALAASFYALVLSLTVPVLVGEGALRGLDRALSRIWLIGPFLSLLTSVDIWIASKVWGLEEEGGS
ncbi:MAG: oligosaccharide flippase family protein [Acidilobaceae archaeon]|nr:oligosaccharide flippase family protein [Acidilobaceae archaeon]MDW7974859.1 oligosaccharide flippase family protein [Sulfolobales archaeon]